MPRAPSTSWANSPTMATTMSFRTIPSERIYTTSVEISQPPRVVASPTLTTERGRVPGEGVPPPTIAPMGRRLRTTFLLGVLVGLALALLRALQRDGAGAPA